MFRGNGIQDDTDAGFEATTGTCFWLAVQSMYTGEPCECHGVRRLWSVAYSQRAFNSERSGVEMQSMHVGQCKRRRYLRSLRSEPPCCAGSWPTRGVRLHQGLQDCLTNPAGRRMRVRADEQTLLVEFPDPQSGKGPDRKSVV